jgi:hypothetical protein
MIFVRWFVFMGVFFLIGCGGGGGSTKTSTLEPSSEYQGKREQTLLDLSNIKKFTEANYYSNIFPLEIDGSKSKGIVVDNHINSMGLGYIDTTYTNYIHKNSVVSNGKVKSTVLSVKKLAEGYLVNVKVDMDILYKLTDREIKFKMIYRSDFNTALNQITKLTSEKYSIEDSKSHDTIEIMQDNQKFRLYIASEGYVNIKSISNDIDSFYGKNGTQLTMDFIEEKSIYNGETKLYSLKKGQGKIELVLNEKEVNPLFFTPYKILEKEMPKFLESDIATFSLDSWNISYALLNKDSNTTVVTVEWFVNGVKVENNDGFELLKSNYNKDDNVKLRITADNGESIVVKEQVLNAERDDYYWMDSVKDEYRFDIDYRTNELSFDINLLTHEFFKNIDVEQSKFSWKAKYITLEEGTEKSATPHVTFREYTRSGTELFLKILHNGKVDVIKFKIHLYHGVEGYDIKPRILATLTDVNVSNEGKRGYIRSMTHYDVDNNGLEDIIYTAVEYKTPKKYTLNVIYQDEKMKFDSHESYTIAERLPSIFTSIRIGDFNGDGKKDIAVPFIIGNVWEKEMNEEHYHIISLERGAYRELKEINTTNIQVCNTSDMNGDGKDDFLTYNRENNKSVIYTNIDNLSEKIVLSKEINRCIDNSTRVVDLNRDGLNDMIDVFSIKKVADKNGVGYNDMLVVGYYIQLANHQYQYTEKSYRFSYITSSYKNSYLNYISIIDEHILICTGEDADGQNFLYSFDLNGDDKLVLLSKVAINGSFSSFDKFTFIDINHDGKKDLVVDFLDVFYQREDYAFSSNYHYNFHSDLNVSNESNVFNYYSSFIADLDNDGYAEMVGMMYTDKFYLLNFNITTL